MSTLSRASIVMMAAGLALGGCSADRSNDMDRSSSQSSATWQTNNSMGGVQYDADGNRIDNNTYTSNTNANRPDVVSGVTSNDQRYASSGGYRLDANGNRVDQYGNHVDSMGYRADSNGNRIGGPKSNEQPYGSSTSSSGYRVDANGNRVDSMGYRIDSNGDRINSGDHAGYSSSDWSNTKPHDESDLEHGWNKSTSIGETELPATVRSTFQRMSQGNALVETGRTSRSGKTGYCARTTINGMSYKMATDADGNLLWMKRVDASDQSPGSND